MIVKGAPNVKLDFLLQMVNAPHVQILSGVVLVSVTNRRDAQNAKLGIILTLVNAKVAVLLFQDVNNAEVRTFVLNALHCF